MMLSTLTERYKQGDKEAIGIVSPCVWPFLEQITGMNLKICDTFKKINERMTNSINLGVVPEIMGYAKLMWEFLSWNSELQESREKNIPLPFEFFVGLLCTLRHIEATGKERNEKLGTVFIEIRVFCVECLCRVWEPYQVQNGPQVFNALMSHVGKNISPPISDTEQNSIRRALQQTFLARTTWDGFGLLDKYCHSNPNVPEWFVRMLMRHYMGTPEAEQKIYALAWYAIHLRSAGNYIPDELEVSAQKAFFVRACVAELNGKLVELEANITMQCEWMMSWSNTGGEMTVTVNVPEVCKHIDKISGILVSEIRNKTRGVFNFGEAKFNVHLKIVSFQKLSLYQGDFSV